jgi:enoyl-CoA hydratase/carnithine racemase
MPETGIGFYPDVGGTYLLSRLPCSIGFYLGLSGARLSYQDCAALGLVTHVIDRCVMSDVIYALQDTVLDQDVQASVTEVLAQFAVASPKPTLLQHKADIEKCFAKNTVEEIFAALAEQPSEWCQETLALLKMKSPTSLRVTLRALHIGKTLSFKECMRMEYRLTNRFLAGDDFFEGIRAVIIDKDQSPHWQPMCDNDTFNHYFSPLAQELIP